MNKASVNCSTPCASLQPLVGQRFVANCGNRGTWEWVVDTEPRLALDNSGKWFVWANALRQVKRGTHNRNPGTRVFYLPFPALPNTKLTDAAAKGH